MVGTHTIIEKDKVNYNINDFDFLKHEKWFNIDVLHTDPNTTMIKSDYHGYPFEVFDDRDYLVVFEGMIYNYTDIELKNRLITVHELSLQKLEQKDKKICQI